MVVSEYFDSVRDLSFGRAINEAVEVNTSNVMVVIMNDEHNTANVSLNKLNLSLIYKFRLISSMQVLLIVVLQIEFLVKLVKKNVVIWKITVQHQIVIHILLRI